MYCHYFALEIYNELCADEDHQEKDHHDKLLLTMIKLQSLPLTTYLHGNHHKMEQVYTAILARTLDRYLFSDEEVNNAAAYHQLPSRKKDGHTGCRGTRCIHTEMW